jgi:hypothetical protein
MLMSLGHADLEVELGAEWMETMALDGRRLGERYVHKRMYAIQYSWDGSSGCIIHDR